MNKNKLQSDSILPVPPSALAFWEQEPLRALQRQVEGYFSDRKAVSLSSPQTCKLGQLLSFPSKRAQNKQSCLWVTSPTLSHLHGKHSLGMLLEHFHAQEWFGGMGFAPCEFVVWKNPHQRAGLL